jgi:ribonuclease HIII
MNRILQSREIWLLARANTRPGVPDRILTAEPSADTRLPELRNHPNCSIFADREAAAPALAALRQRQRRFTWINSPTALSCSMAQPQNLYSCKLTEPQAARLETLLRQGNYEPYEVAFATCAARKEGLNIVLYKSLKLVIQGKRTAEFVEFTLEPEILQEARIGYEEELEPERYLPRIGVDESGKATSSAPLRGGVYANEAALRSWKNVGVQDSKNIKNDQQISILAQKIRETPGVVQNVVAIGNEAYNRLHTKMKTVNQVLAWGHARVIENLLGQSLLMVPPPVKAISDQFAGTAATVERL